MQRSGKMIHNKKKSIVPEPEKGQMIELVDKDIKTTVTFQMHSGKHTHVKERANVLKRCTMNLQR
jgi:hypothetical protein